MNAHSLEVILRGVPWVCDECGYRRVGDFVPPCPQRPEYGHVFKPNFPAMARVVWEVVQKERQTDPAWAAIADREKEKGDALRAERDRQAEEVARLRAALQVLLTNQELGEYESQKRGLPRMTEAQEQARAALAPPDAPGKGKNPPA